MRVNSPGALHRDGVGLSGTRDEVGTRVVGVRCKMELREGDYSASLP